MKTKNIKMNYLLFFLVITGVWALTPAQNAAFMLVKIAEEGFDRTADVYEIYRILDAFAAAASDCEPSTVTFIIQPYFYQNLEACKLSLEYETYTEIRSIQMARDGTLYVEFNELRIGRQAQLLRLLMDVSWIKDVNPH
jgi:hypothetical protein